jgi:hypothetical protein
LSLDANVTPGVLAALKTLTPATIKSVHLGEQFKVSGRGPVAWVMGNTWGEPEYEGSDLEPTDWVIEVRLLYQFAPDQRHAEEVLQALIEPIRAAFRMHRKLTFSALGINPPPSPIARAKTAGGRFDYIVVNRVMYRMMTVNVAVKEKQVVTIQAGG